MKECDTDMMSNKMKQDKKIFWEHIFAVESYQGLGDQIKNFFFFFFTALNTYK